MLDMTPLGWLGRKMVLKPQHNNDIRTKENHKFDNDESYLHVLHVRVYQGTAWPITIKYVYIHRICSWNWEKKNKKIIPKIVIGICLNL